MAVEGGVDLVWVHMLGGVGWGWKGLNVLGGRG